MLPPVYSLTICRLCSCGFKYDETRLQSVKRNHQLTRIVRWDQILTKAARIEGFSIKMGNLWLTPSRNENAQQHPIFSLEHKGRTLGELWPLKPFWQNELKMLFLVTK